MKIQDPKIQEELTILHELYEITSVLIVLSHNDPGVDALIVNTITCISAQRSGRESVWKI